MQTVIEQGVNAASKWLYQWLDERAKLKNDRGEQLFSDKMIGELKQRLNDVRVYVGNENLKMIQQDLNAGRLTPQDVFMNESSSKEIDSSFSQMLAGVDDPSTVLTPLSGVKEPAIVVNASGVEKLMANDKAFRLDKTMTALMTSAIMTNDMHQEVLGVMNKDRSNFFMMMYGTEEVSAYLNGMRNELGLEPFKQYTVEEVARLRDGVKIADEQAKGVSRPSANPHASFLFKNFSDEQIADLLNEVAYNRSNRNMEGLELEHNTGDRLAMDQLHQNENKIKVGALQSQQIDPKSDLDLSRSGRHLM